MELESEKTEKLKNGLVNVKLTGQSKKSQEVREDIRPALEKIYGNGYGQRREIRLLKSTEKANQDEIQFQNPVANCNAPVPRPRKKRAPTSPVPTTSLPTPKPRTLRNPIPTPRPDLASGNLKPKDISYFNWRYILSRLRYLKIAVTFLITASSLIWIEYRNDTLHELNASDKVTATEFHTMLLPQRLSLSSAPWIRFSFPMSVEEGVQHVKYRRVLAKQAKFVTKKIAQNLSMLEKDFHLRGFEQPVMEVLNVSAKSPISTEVVSHWLSEKSRNVSEKRSQRLIDSSLTLGNNWEKILTCPVRSISNASLSFCDVWEYGEAENDRKETTIKEFQSDTPLEAGEEVVTVLGTSLALFIIKFVIY